MSVTKSKLSLVAVAVIGACFNTSQAAQITVDSPLDDGTNCTLRDAITSVNQGPGIGFVEGCSPANPDLLGANDQIVFDLSLNDESIYLAGTELLIEKPVAIDASNLNTLTIDANKQSRVMQINIAMGDADVSLGNLTLLNGLPDSTSGGGVLLDGVASLDINDCTISGNTARFGGGIYATSSGSLTISGSTITQNRALDGGGAGLLSTSNPSSVYIGQSSFTHNFSSYDGGGITTSANLVVIVDTTISHNSAGRSGGGINVSRGLTINNSTLSANSTAGVGGAIGSLRSAQNPRITNSTISGNISDDGAGTFHTPNATSFSLQNSTLKDNVSSATEFNNAADVGLLNSIFSQADGVVDCGEFNSIFSTEQSIIEGDACGTPAATILTGLEPLADNGGLTLTHALLSGSTAINAGDSDSCPDTDQRGRERDNNCDIGAYEFVVDDVFFVIPVKGGGTAIIPL